MMRKLKSNSGKGLTYTSPTDHPLKKGLINTIEILSGRPKVQRLYRELESENPKDKKLWQEILKKLNISLEYDRRKVEKIPQYGPVILIANHPFGVVDGLILGCLLAERRLDFSLIVNEVLTREKLLKKYFLPIDFRNNKEALRTNIDTRKKAMNRLINGESLGIFPSGGVATTPKIIDKKAEDLEWKRFVVKILISSKATIVPVYFHGQNSTLFQWASHIHPNFRLALLMHEVTNKMNTSIKVDILEPISFDDIPKGLSKIEVLDFLREKTLRDCN